jgi:hypothetical protein
VRELEVALFTKVLPDSALFDVLPVNSLADLIVSRRKYIGDAMPKVHDVYLGRGSTSISQNRPTAYIDAHFSGFTEILRISKLGAGGNNLVFMFEGQEVGHLLEDPEAPWVFTDLTGNWINLRISPKSSVVKFLQSASRSFNELKTKDRLAIKQVRDAKKFEAELKYYENLPAPIRDFFPLPIEQIDRSRHSYGMRFINQIDLSIMQIHNCLTSDRFKDFLSDLDAYLLKRPTLLGSGKENISALRELGINKLKRRMQELTGSHEFPNLDSLTRDLLGFDLWQFANKVALTIERLLQAESKNDLRWFHGDLCFSNILWNPQTRSLILIDPRGYEAGGEGWGPPAYDVAKLAQSAIRGGDYIINRCERHMREFNSQSKIFADWVREQPHDPRLIDALTASLLLSLLPLHLDSPESLPEFILRAAESYTDSNLGIP